MSLFKRKKAGEEANTIPEAMDDITQTLLMLTLQYRSGN